MKVSWDFEIPNIWKHTPPQTVKNVDNIHHFYEIFSEWVSVAPIL